MYIPAKSIMTSSRQQMKESEQSSRPGEAAPGFIRPTGKMVALKRLKKERVAHADLIQAARSP